MAERSSQTGGDSFSHCYSTRGEPGGFPTGNYFSRKSRLRSLTARAMFGKSVSPELAKTTNRRLAVEMSPHRLLLIKTGHLLSRLANERLSFADLIVQFGRSFVQRVSEFHVGSLGYYKLSDTRRLCEHRK